MFFVGGIFALLLIPLILIFAFGIPILMAFLVYRDASKRVDCSPWLWALVAALVPSFIGVIVYLIIRRDYPLKSEYRMYGGHATDRSGDDYMHAQYGYAKADGTGNGTASYAQYPSEKKSMPTWAKALIIIGLVIFAICIIGMMISVMHYFAGYSVSHNYYDGFHY